MLDEAVPDAPEAPRDLKIADASIGTALRGLSSQDLYGVLHILPRASGPCRECSMIPCWGPAFLTEDLPAQDICLEPRLWGEVVTTHEGWYLAVLTCLLGAGLDCLPSWL